MDAADLTARWAGAWGDCRPIGASCGVASMIAGWTHLWVSVVRFPGEDLTRLLRLVADYVAAGVIIIIIITTADMSWLYHPYDGGADVIAATAGQRDRLRREHQEWLSAHPAGL